MGARTVSKPQPVVTSSSLTTTLSGEAIAVGENTLALGTADSTITDKGPVTKAKGTITATATAQAAGEDLSYATAYTFAEIEGADHFTTKTKIHSTISQTEGQTTVTETSVTKLHAIAIEIGKDAKHSKLPAVQDEADDVASWLAGGAIEGNVAAFDVEAQAYGDNSYVGVDVFILTLEDQLSTVSLSVITAVD
jgi:hypothetical protein